MIRFYNARILTMADGCEITEGELWTDGDVISYIGETPAELPAFEREINAGGNLLMPSFKNAHTHSAMTFLRSFAEDVPLQKWLFEKVFPYEDRLTAEDVYAFDRLAILEYLASGTTAFFDMYFYPDSTVQAAIESGIRAVLCGSINGTVKDVERLNDQFQKFRHIHPRIGYRLGFHAEYTSDEGLHRGVAELAHAEKEPVYTHISETEREHLECIERHGASPAQYFESIGLWEYGGGGFHGVWFDGNDRAVFRRNDLWMVSCPASNAKLASGIAPLKEAYEEGVQLALGTDGPASNNALDPFREMYLGAVLQKLRHNDAAAIPANVMLQAATVGGARAMGLHDCDILAPGKQADLILIDLHAPNLQPIYHIPESLVLNGCTGNIRMTMCAGTILYENGEYFIGASPEEIIADTEKRISRLTG
ncbi:MAG: amidohydrolase [Oscillospiraceae bacterium]|nr:amidohydrolase [Oscillospiraceae bacterium]